MSYRRRWQYNQNSGPVKVTLAWSGLVGAYDLKFERIGSHWDKVKGIIEWIKLTVPVGEREYDDVNKVWTLGEKFFPQLKSVLEAMGGQDFDITIVEKPMGSSSIKFTPIDVYLDTFKTFSGTDITNFSEAQFAEAKKLYFRTAMKMHPDRNPHDADAPANMSKFNEAWDVIKERHFKIQKVMEQVQ